MVKGKRQKLKKAKFVKPKYNMWQNSWFMIKLAWTCEEKKVIILSLLSAVLAVALNLVNLYVSPSILSAVERHVSAGELFMTIAGFALGLMLVSAATAYVNTNTLFGRISLRAEITNLLSRKAATTSYPNVDDDEFIKLLVKSRECTYSGNEAAEAIWTTLTMLTTDIFGFLIYVSLLTTVQPLLVLVILATSLVSFFLGNCVNGYGYRHREEEAEYERHMNYLLMRVEDLSAAKDIRIFGLRPWIEELYEKAMSCYTAFHKKAQGVYIWSPIADLVFTFLRNAIAYAFLISLVIRDGLDVAEFLLFAQSNVGIDMERVRECVEKAGLRSKVTSMPDGYETYLNREVYEGATLLSGGETQRLMLARALYKNAPFIILDEPTAALDPVAEAEIYSKFNDIVGDKTAIYISHRLSSCKFCDMIAVFHEGAIIQQGTHDSLVADENGKYYELWHAQAQYYTE